MRDGEERDQDAAGTGAAAPRRARAPLQDEWPVQGGDQGGDDGAPPARERAPGGPALSLAALEAAPHYVLTRFSYLGLSGWKSADSRDAERLFRPERLRQRLALFSALTLPSLARQTDRRFRHVILTSDLMPDWALAALHAACAAAYGDAQGYDILARPPGKARAHLRYYLEHQDGPDPVIQTVLDDDDALPIDFIAKLRGGFPKLIETLQPGLDRLPVFLTAPIGYGLVLRPEAETETGEAGGAAARGASQTGALAGAGLESGATAASAPMAPSAAPVALYRHRYPFINLGLTLIGTRSGKNILAINHQDAPRRFGYHKLGRKPMFIRTLHSFNDSRVSPSERWHRLQDWRLEADLQARFPYLLEADLAAVLAEGG